jgi:PAS domain S-box-containing protein
MRPHPDPPPAPRTAPAPRGRPALALLLAALAGIAAAAPRDDIGLAQFGLQRWDAEDGLGGNWVRDLVEDPDGRIWVGTGVGLSRFGGRVFTAEGGGGLAALPQRSVSALARASDGGLWVGLALGGVRRIDAGGGPLVAPPVLPSTVAVHDLLEGAGGTLWIASNAGLWRFDAAGLRVVAPDDDARAADVRTVVADPAGAVWARTRRHGLWRIDGERITVMPDAPGCLGYGLAIGPDGERFMSCQQGVWHVPADGGDWRRISDAFGVGPVHLDRRGDLWFGTQEGLTRWSQGRTERLPPERGLGDWRVRAITEDRRGDLWFGSFSGGLARLHRGPVQTIGAPEGLDIDGTSAVLAAPGGDVWVGALRSGLMRVRPGEGLVARWTAQDGLPGDTAWALAADPRDPGGVWVGADAGLAWLAEGRLHPSGPGGESFDGAVALVHVEPGTPPTVWVAGPEGGAVALRGRETVVHDASRGLPLSRVSFLLRDRAGRLLAGGLQGLFALDGERWARHAPGGLQVDALTAAAMDAEGSLWLASSSRGLLRIAGDTHTTWTLDSGLPFWPLHSLDFDRNGGLWMSSDDGLARILLDDHARWRAGELERIPVERLGRRDGLRDVETNGWGQPSHAALGDGRLVYPTARGIAVVDPAAMPSVGLSPEEIYLRAGWAGTRALDLDAPLRLTRDERALRIAFSAIELLRPEAVSFRYQLEGVDRDWVAAGSAAEAVWSGLPPGDFRFLLQARLPGQPWIDAARSLQVSIAPQPWESLALRLAAIAVALLLAAAVVHWRLSISSRHAAVLRRAREFLREVIDTSPNPIFVRDRAGAYSLANRAAAEVYRRAPEALEGRDPRELGPAPPGMASIDALDAEVIATGDERVVPEHEIVDGNGRRRWFRVVKRPGFAPDGRTVEQVIGTAVDVTDFKLARERLEREQARLRRSREEARALSHQLLRAQEDERRRLAREIHDDLTQQLAGLSMLAWSTAQAAARQPGGDRREALEQLARGLEQLANDVQALSRELHPPSLEALGLAAALRAECATFGQRTGLPIECLVEPLPSEPPTDVGLALYRITQEALRNCLTHAQAGRVVVNLRGDDQGLRLEIVDDGVGFDAARVDAGPGIGLSGMRERARLAGATLAIDSAPGRGTTIAVAWRDGTRRRSRTTPDE